MKVSLPSAAVSPSLTSLPVESVSTETEVTSLPDQTVYLEAKDPFDPTGGVITLTYAGGETGTVDLGDASVTGFDNTAVGVQTLSAAFAGQTAQFSITIKAKTLIAVSILTLPENLVYFEGDPFDPAGGVLQLEYDNDTTSTVGFADAAVTGYDCDLIGEQTLTVSVGGKSDTFTVTVLLPDGLVLLGSLLGELELLLPEF